MDKRLIALGIAAGMMVTAVAPLVASANHHTSSTNHGHHMKQMDKFQMFLVQHGYFSETSSRTEMRMGIKKFQKENMLPMTGVIGIKTRQAIVKQMNLPSIAETAIATPTLSTLVAAVKAGGLVDTLMNGGPFTVFAPTNDAFAKIPAETLTSLLTPEKKSDLVNILTYHVVSGKALSGDLVDGQEIKTLQ